ncbi:MAG: phage major capsid protein [Candidatus Acidiferrum sp.]
MTVDTKGLATLILEASNLSKKPQLTKQEERRNAWLLASISALKQGGITLAELDHEDYTQRCRRAGVEPRMAPSKLTASAREVRSWQAMLAGEAAFKQDMEEHRDMTEGPAAPRIGVDYSSLGYFSPTDFFPQLFTSLAAHDGLFDEANVTLIKSTNGRPLPVPIASDVQEVADLLLESYDGGRQNIYSENQTVLGAYSFSSPRFIISLEAIQDMEQSFTAVALAKRFFGDRIARGIGKYLVNGTGSGQPTGLLTALSTLGAPVVTAQGSDANDGSTATGANSLGSGDFIAALSQLDEAYCSSPRCAWVMSKKTLTAVSGLIDKMGHPIELVKYDDNGKATILGIKVVICPSMPAIDSGNVPVVLGDLTYYATRLITDDASGIVVFREAPGVIEQGNVAIRCFVRADGNCLWEPDEATSPGEQPTCPFVQIQNA